MKNNGHFGVTTAAYGGHNPILGFCHTFNRMIPAFATFRKHPEYFAETPPAGDGEEDDSYADAVQELDI